MNLRPVTPEVGAHGWVEHSHQYPLPEGLADKEPITVTGVNEHDVTVKTKDGREWDLDKWQVDCGYEYCYSDGGWLHESRPEILAYNAARLKYLRTSAPMGPIGRYEREIDRVAFILQRNGMAV